MGEKRCFTKEEKIKILEYDKKYDWSKIIKKVFNKIKIMYNLW